MLGGLCPSLPSILEPRSSLIVLRPGRWQSPELEVPLVEYSIEAPRDLLAGRGSEGEDEVGHDRGGLPLSRGDAWVEVRVSRF